MREFTREFREDMHVVNRRFATASVISAVLAGIAFVDGAAALLGYQPIIEQFAVMGVPSWVAPVSGAIEIVAAVALLFPTTGFFAALVLGGMFTCAAILYVKIGESGFATVSALLALAYFIDMVVRTPEILIEGKRLWAPSDRVIVTTPTRF
jgi:hypothetical protein